MASNDFTLEYWGKAGEGGEFHPLPYHSLDVAASGLALLDGMPRLRVLLEQLSGLDSRSLDGWIGFFLAIHDLGKFSSAFQHLRPELARAGQRRYAYFIRHDTLGYGVWVHHYRKDEELRARLGRIGEVDSQDLADLLEFWVHSVTGHHGQPPKMERLLLTQHFSEQDIDAAMAWTRTAAELFLPVESSPFRIAFDQIERQVAELSWWLAGLCILADWIGSNREHFPYRRPTLSSERYWHEIARLRADYAVRASGILPVRPTPDLDAAALFDFDDYTPLQRACLQCPVEGPGQLFIMEDVTGAGKTEAAFLLLARLMAAGNADGAYVALPTMATANAMYARTSQVYRRLFDGDTADSPSLVLAHGSRQLHEQFRASVIHRQCLDNEQEYASGDRDAQTRCNAWLADNNKKALLAQIGVGTIDQALLAVLKSRHQALRLLGLLGKVLIIDEVHASDAYMHRLLCQLLQFHSRAGGSAILLSATLPMRMRRELLHAWGAEPGADDELQLDYPLLTRVRNGSGQRFPVQTRASVRRELGFALIADQQEIIDWLVEQARSGRCVAWIRNTVDDAVKAYRTITGRLGAANVTLFHARFALGDRLEIEEKVLDAFGPDSTAGSRTGRVVIATQVIEQSLDLDFDEMVSDLAPIDLLIQRAGRLRRHRRDAQGNRVADDASDQRGEIVLRIFSPQPDADANERWIRGTLPGTAAVYPDHARLWLTANFITSHGRLRIPEDLREAIGRVYSDDGIEQVPDALRASADKAEGAALADTAQARMNAISPTEGYRHTGGEWWDESRTPTRLGDPAITVRLARWDGPHLTPWRMDEQATWAYSEVRIRAAFIDRIDVGDPEALQSIESVRSQWPRAMRNVMILPLQCVAGKWHCEALNQRGKSVTLEYSPVYGLVQQSSEENHEPGSA